MCRGKTRGNWTLSTVLVVDINSNVWNVNSGDNKELLNNFVVDSRQLLTSANNQTMYSESHGDV